MQWRVIKPEYRLVDIFESVAYDVLWDLKIGKPIGDADNDGELTIVDATLIQRYRAKLISDEEIGEV